jgi:hypothetical protein
MLTRDHEPLNRVDDEDIVDVEARMSVVERQEPVERELRAEVVVLAAEHLLAHSHSDLRLEVEDSPKTEITALATLVVFDVLDATAAPECRHTRVDILVHVQALLRLGDAPARAHEDPVEQIRMAVMQLATNPC